MAELDRNRIAKAALAVLEESGFKGFSMRAVAKSLNVTPMALYHHVKDKDDLASLTIEALIREFPAPDSRDDWREELFSLASWMRESTLAYPAVAQLRRAHRVWIPEMTRIIERWRECWLRSGLQRAAALRASGASSIAILGLVEEEMNLLQFHQPDADIMDKVVNIQAIFASPENSRENFELVVRSLLDGLYANLKD